MRLERNRNPPLWPDLNPKSGAWGLPAATAEVLFRLLSAAAPERLTLLGRGEIEEERAQRKAPAQLRRQARDRVTGRNEQHPPLRNRVDDLERRAQPFGRGANKRTLHGRQVKSNRGDARCAAR